MEKSALVFTEIFRLFVNTLTPNENYSHRNMQICLPQLQTPLFQTENIFSGFFVAFPKSASHLEHS